MDVTAVTRFARLAPLKARDLVRSIQGLRVEDALKIVAFSERKAARLISRTLKSAVANAENNAELSADDLYVKQAVVDGGPTAPRYWSRSRGMARRIRRRYSHIRVTLSDEKRK